jgi:hypothetical protein
MFFSQSDQGNGGALWDIWMQESMASLSEILRSKFPAETEGLLGTAGPILSELFYIDNAIQRDTFLLDGHPTWRYKQQPGDVIFIPPRCPHQVGYEIIIKWQR